MNEYHGTVAILIKNFQFPASAPAALPREFPSLTPCLTSVTKVQLWVKSRLQCGIQGLQGPAETVHSAWNFPLVCSLYLVNSYASFRTSVDTTFFMKTSWPPQASWLFCPLIQQVVLPSDSAAAGQQALCRALGRQCWWR